MRKAIWVGLSVATLAMMLGAGPVQAASTKKAATAPAGAADAAGDAKAAPKTKKHHHKKSHKGSHTTGDAAGMK